MKNFPIILSDSGSLAAGKSFTPNLELMQNVYRHPIRIDEMRVMLTNLAGGLLPSLGALARVRLDSGRFPITNGFIPIGLIGLRETGQIAPWGVLNSNGNGFHVTFDYYKWRLPMPVYLDVGEAFLPNFQWIAPDNAVAGGTSPLVVDISLVARTVEAIPKRLRVPYVTAFLPNNGEGHSNEQDLRNPFDVPLKIHQLCTKIFVPSTAILGAQTSDSVIDTDSSLAYLAYFNGVAQERSNVFPEPAGTSLSLQAALKRRFKLQDDHGYGIVKDYSSWMSIFNGPSMVWSTEAEIPAKERWHLTLEDVCNTVLNIGSYYIPTVSIIGSREEVRS